jgi:hypothetical protein
MDDDLVREWSGSRYGTVVMLSELAAEKYGLDFQQGAPTTALPDTLHAAFGTARWVVKPFAQDQDAARDPVGTAFDRIGRSGSNPYFDANVDRDRHEYGDRDRGDRVRSRGESPDGQRAEPNTVSMSMSMSPVSLAVAAESFGQHHGEFATNLVGTSRPGWSTILERERNAREKSP